MVTDTPYKNNGTEYKNGKQLQYKGHGLKKV
jgi:hypothetical protein